MHRSSVALRRAIIATLGAVLVLLLSHDGRRPAAPGYVLTDLGTFGNLQSAHANDLDEAGMAVGQAAGRAFVWRNGSLTQLPTKMVLAPEGKTLFVALSAPFERPKGPTGQGN